MALLSASITPTNLVTTSGAATLTNKTITSPTVSGATITGGTINNTTVGASTPSTGAFTTLSASGATTLSAQLIASTGDTSYPIISRDTSAFSVGVSGSKIGFFGLDSTSTNNALGAISTLAQASQSATLRVQVLNSGSLTTIGTFSTTGLAIDGIKFPASQSASADANTLDDYEEGTWTPVVSDALSGGNLATMTTDGSTNGTYTKIGNMVYWRFSANLTNKASMTAGNTVFFQGFPFQAAAISGSWYNPNPTIIRNITFTDYVQFHQAGNTTYGYLRENVSNANGDDIIVSDLTNSAAIQASGFYRVA